MIRLFISFDSLKRATIRAKKKKIDYYGWFMWWLSSVIRTFFPIVYLFEQKAKDLDNVD